MMKGLRRSRSKAHTPSTSTVSCFMPRSMSLVRQYLLLLLVFRITSFTICCRQANRRRDAQEFLMAHRGRRRPYADRDRQFAFGLPFVGPARRRHVGIIAADRRPDVAFTGRDIVRRI